MDDFVESAEPDMEEFQSSHLVLFLEVVIQLFACGTLYRDPSPILAMVDEEERGRGRGIKKRSGLRVRSLVGVFGS